jgi:hypothetical protein
MVRVLLLWCEEMFNFFIVKFIMQSKIRQSPDPPIVVMHELGKLGNRTWNKRPQSIYSLYCFVLLYFICGSHLLLISCLVKTGISESAQNMYSVWGSGDEQLFSPLIAWFVEPAGDRLPPVPFSHWLLNFFSVTISLVHMFYFIKLV